MNDEDREELRRRLHNAIGDPRTMDVTTSFKTALYALGRDDIADSVTQVGLSLLPGQGIGVTFAVKHFGKWTPPDDVGDGLIIQDHEMGERLDGDGKVLVEVLQFVLRGGGVPFHYHDDGSLHVGPEHGSQHPALGPADHEEIVSGFMKELDEILGGPPSQLEKPDQGDSGISKWL